MMMKKLTLFMIAICCVSLFSCTEDKEKELVISIEKIEINKTTVELEVEGTSTLSVTITPEDASVKTITWTSSDDDIAIVENGLVTAMSVGTATITASSNNKMLATSIVTISAKVINVTSIELDNETAELNPGDTKTLVATILPSLATDKSIVWTSSDDAIATVSNKGLVSAIKIGEVTITASSSNNMKAICKLNIAEKIIDVASITLDLETIELNPTDTKTIVATVLPELATNKNLTWTSSDDAIATISNEGLVTAIKVGEITITAKSSNDIAATCKVNITEKIIDAESITINNDSYSLALDVEKTAQLTVAFLPANTTDKKITWSCSEAGIVTVSETGLLTAVNAGFVDVTATTSNNKTKVITVNIYGKRTSLSFQKSTLSATVEEQILPQIISVPTNANPNLIWTSSDENIVSIGKDDFDNTCFNALKLGTATITVTDPNDSSINAECTINVEHVYATELVFTPESGSLLIGENLELNPTTIPEDCKSEDYKWYADDGRIAKISQSGIVTGLSKGTTTIHCSGKNSRASGSYEITVYGKYCDLKTEYVSQTGLTCKLTYIYYTDKNSIRTYQVGLNLENKTNKSLYKEKLHSSNDHNIINVGESSSLAAGAKLLQQLRFTCSTYNVYTEIELIKSSYNKVIFPGNRKLIWDLTKAKPYPRSK